MLQDFHATREEGEIRYRIGNLLFEFPLAHGSVNTMTQTIAIIRQYVESDRDQLCDCFAALQDYERNFEPRRIPGAEIADNYVSDLLTHCREKNGKIFVATLSDKVVGFSCVFTEEMLDEVLNGPNHKVAYVSDLFVKEELRGSGAGKALMIETEKFAKQSGAMSMVLNVLADNQSSRQFYSRVGFKEYEVKLAKEL